MALLHHAPMYVGIFIGAVLLWSAAAKLTRPRQTAYALIAFRVIRRPSIGAAFALAAVEGTIGSSLIAAAMSSTHLSVLLLGVTSILFAAFVLVIARALRRGDSFPCMCFGSSAAKLSRITLLRGGALLVAAAAATAAAAMGGWVLSFDAALAALSASAGCLGISALAAGLARLGPRIDPFDFADPGSLIPDGGSLLRPRQQ